MSHSTITSKMLNVADFQEVFNDTVSADAPAFEWDEVDALILSFSGIAEDPDPTEAQSNLPASTPILSLQSPIYFDERFIDDDGHRSYESRFTELMKVPSVPKERDTLQDHAVRPKR
jgi:hypothetical protein